MKNHLIITYIIRWISSVISVMNQTIYNFHNFQIFKFQIFFFLILELLRIFYF